MDALKIRPANLADKAEIENCVNLAYEKYISRIGKKPHPMLEDYALLIEKGNVFVGEWRDQIVGVLVLLPFLDYISLDNVAVTPLYQGLGFGKKFLHFAEDYTKQRGKKEIRLYTNIKMVENLAIYKKLGYIETETKWEDGYHRVYFFKHL